MKLSQLSMMGALIVALPLSSQAAEVPLDPQAAVPSAPYQSAFTDYKSYQDGEMVPWRTANDEIGRAGGMAGHDMSGMKGMDGMDGMKGKEKMADMPGHGMGGMKGSAASPSAGKPVERAPQTMPDHNGMQKQ